MSTTATKTPPTTWIGLALIAPFLMSGAAMALLPAHGSIARATRVPALVALGAYVVLPPILGAISRFAYPNAPRRVTYSMLGIWGLLMALLAVLATAVPVEPS